MIELNDVDRVVLVVRARDRVHMRVDIEGAGGERRKMRVRDEADELVAFRDRLDAGMLPRLPPEIILDHPTGGCRLVMAVAEHHPIDADCVAVIVVAQEFPERAVLVRQDELVDVEYGNPFRLMPELLAEMRISATLNGVARRPHDRAL